MAAGRGERLWPLTETRPKHMLSRTKKPIIERTIEAIAEAGIRQVILVVRFKSETISERFGDGGKVNCEIEYVKQRTPRGTADAVAAAGDELKAEDRFLVMYGDDYYEKRVVKDFLAKAQLDEGISIATAPVEDSSPFGVIETKNGRVAKIREKLPKRTPEIVKAGLNLATQT